MRWMSGVLLVFVACGCRSVPVVKETVDRTVRDTASVVTYVSRNIRFGHRRKTSEELSIKRQMRRANGQMLSESWRRMRTTTSAMGKKYASYSWRPMSCSIARQGRAVRRREKLQSAAQEQQDRDRARRELANVDFSESLMTDSLAQRLVWDIGQERSRTLAPTSFAFTNAQSSAIIKPLRATANGTEMDVSEPNPPELIRILPP